MSFRAQRENAISCHRFVCLYELPLQDFTAPGSSTSSERSRGYALDGSLSSLLSSCFVCFLHVNLLLLSVSITYLTATFVVAASRRFSSTSVSHPSLQQSIQSCCAAANKSVEVREVRGGLSQILYWCNRAFERVASHLARIQSPDFNALIDVAFKHLNVRSAELSHECNSDLSE